MTYTPKAGSFALFKNDKKTQDNHPDYKGDGVDLQGNPIWVSAWLKVGTKGKFMSCSMQRKDAQKAKTESKPAPPPDELEEIPF